ncbi:2238_t:CDS:2 [Dentiscutata heterogama]|uniref:2238_t:CDS:1 n=1 Tax=Dentiscutata heterogama TaxID=1316150 RepID=A0ACA9LDM1_9GLOM|nr:2238_t:CDS:2 [Dentiscutata heterogama]
MNERFDDESQMSNENNSVLCEECGQKINATNWCKSCNAKRFEIDFPNWTSGNIEIDKFIRKTQITAERCECIFEWVDYSKFKFLEKIQLSNNHKAFWEDGHLLGWDKDLDKWNRQCGQWVKLVTNQYDEKHLIPRFLQLEHEISKKTPSKRIVYGMTRNPKTGEYAVIEKLLKQCHFCHQEWVYPRWCRHCNVNYFKSEFPKWTSGNSKIDTFIQEAQLTAELPDQVLEWLPENQFTGLSQIGSGGYGTVYKAYRKCGRICKWDFTSNTYERGESMWVALKSVHDKENINILLEETKALLEFRKTNLGSIDCYGITQHPVTKDYLIVMRYVERGDLRTYLTSTFDTITWKDRLDRLWSLAIDIRSLHRLGLVHRDLHSGNVLFGDNRRSFVADLGLASSTLERWVQFLSEDKSIDDDDGIKNQFKLAKLKRQKNSYSNVLQSLTSQRLPRAFTIAISIARIARAPGTGEIYF